MNSLETIQPDIFFKLASEPALASVTVFKVREADIESKLAETLGGLGLTGAAQVTQVPAAYCRPGTGIGASIEVMMPMFVQAPDRNAPGPDVLLKILMRVKESHVENLGPNGTKMTAETIAQTILGILQLWGSQNNLSLFAFDSPLAPNRDFLPLVCYDVAMFSKVYVGGTPGVATVTYAENAPLQVTLACATAGALIYYTTDLSFPGSANPAAEQYTVPFTVPANTNIRAAAYLAGSYGSPVTGTLFTV